MRKLFSALGAATLLALPLLAEAQADPAQVEKGRYLAIAGDCAACHSAPGRPAFSGGLALSSPLGTIYSTNITPSREHGIGGYSLEAFSAALREGRRGDGAQLYPAMPYTAYAKLSEEDVAALYAYFTQGVEAAEVEAPQTALPFPFNLRFSMAFWNLLFHDDSRYQPDPERSPEWNRGAYLVQGLAHCGTCHTPRNLLMAEQPARFLEGASLGTWYAPAVGLNEAAGWDRQALAQYLASGRAHNGATAAGPMAEAIEKSFSKMRSEDIEAMVEYIASLPAHAESAPVASEVPPVANSDIEEMAGRIEPGEQLYRDNCASCHQLDGRGQRGLPALYQHPLLRHPNADNVGMAILEGVWPEHGQGMLGFADELSDEQVSQLTHYVMATFGNSPVRLDAQRVAELRSGGAQPLLVWLARGGMLVGALLVLGVLLLWLRRRRR